MLRQRFELLEMGSSTARLSLDRPVLALADRSESGLASSGTSSALMRTRIGTSMATPGGLSRSDSVRAGVKEELQRSSTLLSPHLAGEFAPSSSSSQLLQSTSLSNMSAVVQHEGKLPPAHAQHGESNHSPQFQNNVSRNDAKGIGPGEAAVLAAAIGRLDRLCTFSSQTTGLGLRVDRWHSKAYTLNAPGSADYPREKLDKNGNVVEAFGGEGTPVMDRLDLSGINFGPHDLHILTRWLFKPEVLPTLTSINVSKNPLIGQAWRPDEHIAAFIPFIELLANSNVKELRMANIGMGFEATL